MTPTDEDRLIVEQSLAGVTDDNRAEIAKIHSDVIDHNDQWEARFCELGDFVVTQLSERGLLQYPEIERALPAVLDELLRIRAERNSLLEQRRNLHLRCEEQTENLNEARADNDRLVGLTAVLAEDGEYVAALLRRVMKAHDEFTSRLRIGTLKPPPQSAFKALDEARAWLAGLRTTASA